MAIYNVKYHIWTIETVNGKEEVIALDFNENHADYNTDPETLLSGNPINGLFKMRKLDRTNVVINSAHVTSVKFKKLITGTFNSDTNIYTYN